MLIIIDMQYEFWTAADVVEPVCAAVRRAKDEGRTIVLVEYACDLTTKECRDERSTCLCRTYDEVMEAIGDYENLVLVTKAFDDGGEDIMREVSEFPPEVEVCGVNTTACVRDTVITLAEELPHVEFKLLLEACNAGAGQEPFTHEWVDNFRNVHRNTPRAA